MKLFYIIIPGVFLLFSCGDENAQDIKNEKEVNTLKGSEDLDYQLENHPQILKIPDQDTMLESYDQDSRDLRAVWREGNKVRLEKINNILKSYDDVIKKQKSKYYEVSNKYTHKKEREEKEKTEKILEIQTQVMVELTNKVFDLEADGKRDTETHKKLYELNEKLADLNKRLENFSKYYRDLKESNLGKIRPGSKILTGYDKECDVLASEIEAAHEEYLKAKQDLAKKYAEDLVKYPLEIELIYQTVDEPAKLGYNIFSIYNNTSERCSLDSLKMRIEHEGVQYSYSFSKSRLSNVEKYANIEIQPYQMIFIAVKSHPRDVIEAAFTDASPFKIISKIRNLYEVVDDASIQYSYESNLGSFQNRNTSFHQLK